LKTGIAIDLIERPGLQIKVNQYRYDHDFTLGRVTGVTPRVFRRQRSNTNRLFF